MTIPANISENSRFAVEFLLEANLKSEEGIEDVPVDFIEKHLNLVHHLNATKHERILVDAKLLTTEEQIELESRNDGNVKTKQWTHESVLSLIAETKNPNPIEAIKDKARSVVLYALQKGWTGPPFNSIELAKILDFDISPNDTVLDARTVAISKTRFLIEYNPFQKPNRLNFSVAHEITHTLFPDCYKQIRHREEEPVVNRELEQLCNIGASEFQLPYVIFPKDANDLKEITLESLIALAKKYKSSLESVFLGFVAAIDRNCAIMICSFQSEQKLVLDYHKMSAQFDFSLPNNFEIPIESRAYYCTTPGATERETVTWSIFDKPYNAFYVGISPVRKDNRARVGVIVVPNDGREKLQDRRIIIETGDATKPRGEGIKIIAQVVNTSAGLGFGFGKSLSKNYPSIKQALKTWKERKINFRLGKSQLLSVSNNLYVFQMLAQNALYAKNGKTPLDYQALQLCLAELREEALNLKADVFMPLIGTGQAKGKWEIIEGLIYSELINHDVKVHIYLWGTQKSDDFKPSSSLSLFNEESTWQKEK